MTATHTRGRGMRLAPDAVRAGLINLGLREEVTPTPGYGFTYRKEPLAAVRFWMEQNGGREPSRFYLDRQIFILAD